MRPSDSLTYATWPIPWPGTETIYQIQKEGWPTVFVSDFKNKKSLFFHSINKALYWEMLNTIKITMAYSKWLTYTRFKKFKTIFSLMLNDVF